WSSDVCSSDLVTHMDEVFDLRSDAAQNPEYRLHQQRWLHQSALKEMRQRVEMTDIVTLELETRAAAFAEILQNSFDIGKRVAKNEIAAVLEMLAFPFVFEALVLV